MERTSQQLDDPPDICMRGQTSEATLCTEENTKHRSSEGTSSDPVLEPKHKIFLSHSGAQKEFVEHLCEALERRFHYPFFDKRPSSLPKGEKFPRLIIQAAQECEMAVVVVSEEYFMSKWPMVELNAFVQARRQESNKKLQILPLFYGLSVSEFREEERQEKWYVQWESFAKDDAQRRIKVHEWKDALRELGSFNGISYNRELKEIVAYENAIVSSICHSIEPDIKWDDSHVQGKSNICEVVCKNIEQVGLSRKYNIKVVGLYGVGGIGKTTLCKTMCNELSREYEGQVCHVEFESKGTSSKGLLEKVLMRLTNTSLEVLQRMNEGEYRNILQRTLSRDKTFLAVDNVWDDGQCIEQAKMFLKGPFCEGSLVIVTSRSRRTLELLGVDGDASFEVPDLGLEDAMNLFLYHAAGGKRFVKEEEKRDILECLQRCYFKKGDGGGWHYHPLALEALGSQLSCLGDKPSEWVENLWRVKNFSYLSGGNPVFGILRSSFDLLPLCDQSLFMDLVVYRPRNFLRLFWDIDMKEWLCLVHKQDEAEIKCRLDFLKRRGLLQDVDLASGKVGMHDLYREFAKLEVRGKLDESTDLEKRMWVDVDDGDVSELESSPSVGLSHKLIRLVLKFPRSKNITESLEVINWQYCSNVGVLKLEGDLRWRGGVWSLEPLKCLRSCSLQGVRGLDRVEGLEGLKNLTYFTWVSSNEFCRLGRGERERTQMGRFPASLVVLEIMDAEVLFGPDVLARCTKLRTLKLWGVQAGTLDVSNCSSLQTLEVREVDDLRTLSGLTARSGLKSLKVLDCRNLDDVPGLEQLAGLEQLVLESCRSMAHLQLDLQKLTELRAVKIRGELFSSLCLPRQLQELSLVYPDEGAGPRVIEALKANRLEQLQVLRLSRFDESGLENVGGWPALRCLDLTFCRSLSRLPDLSQSTNLEELDLTYTDGELCEDDVCMLARLRQLQPVRIGRWGDVRWDLVRRKELKHSSHRSAPSAWVDWKEHTWHERDLGIPPYGLSRSRYSYASRVNIPSLKRTQTRRRLHDKGQVKIARGGKRRPRLLRLWRLCCPCCWRRDVDVTR